MQVLFKSRHPQAIDLRALTERRVRFVLRRLGWMVSRAEVRMSDVNGPRGGVDKRCQVELRTDGTGSVVVASVAGFASSAAALPAAPASFAATPAPVAAVSTLPKASS